MAAATNAVNADDFPFVESEQQHWTTPAIQRVTKHNNILPIWKSAETMNLNHLILENIRISPYFKNKLSTLTKYQEVIDELFYQVSHLEPWERGTYKTAGQTGMCGGVRGVGAGGVVSTPFCIMYKLFTLKLTRKQLVQMINHTDSPYIRALGFMYIRFCQPPETFWEWFEPYFDDEEEVDPKAGGGDNMTMGQLVKLLLTKLDWYGTLFPRIPVPVQKAIDQKLREYNLKRFEEEKREREAQEALEKKPEPEPVRKEERRSPKQLYGNRGRERSVERGGSGSRRRSRSRSKRSRSRSRQSPSRSRHSHHHSSSRSRHKDRRSRSRSPRRSKPSEHRSDRKRSRSKSPDSKRHRSGADKHEHKKHKKHRHRHRHHRSHRSRHDDKAREKKDESKKRSSSESDSSDETGSADKRAEETRTNRDSQQLPADRREESANNGNDERRSPKAYRRDDDEGKEEGELADDPSSDKEKSA